MSGRPGETPPSAAEPGPDRLLGRGYQGEVYLRQTSAGALIVKMPIGRGPARAARRAMLRREYAIYQQLEGVSGVPHCAGLVDGEELLLQYIAGPSLREVDLSGAARERFFAELLQLIQALHARGVAHGDLKRKDNILVGPGGQPFLIDFGTAVSGGPRAGSVRRWLFRQMRRMDLNAWVKLKYQRQSLDMDPADARFHRPTLLERLARPLRRAWRAATLRRQRRHRRDPG